MRSRVHTQIKKSNIPITTTITNTSLVAKKPTAQPIKAPQSKPIDPKFNLNLNNVSFSSSQRVQRVKPNFSLQEGLVGQSKMRSHFIHPYRPLVSISPLKSKTIHRNPDAAILNQSVTSIRKAPAPNQSTDQTESATDEITDITRKNPEQFARISPEAIQSLTLEQAGQITMEQAMAMTSEQFQRLTPEQINKIINAIAVSPPNHDNPQETANLYGQYPKTGNGENPKFQQGDLLYGLETYRGKTRKRLGENNPLPKLSMIDNYNQEIGINSVMGQNGSIPAAGIFKVREALKNNDEKKFIKTIAQSHSESEKTILTAWIQELRSKKHNIGLYDFGDKTRKGPWYKKPFQKTEGLKKIKSKNRFTKNFKDQSSVELTEKDIHKWLAQNITYEKAETNLGQLSKTVNVNSLGEWIQKAFFRRTSKLGIDFATGREKKIHFNLASAPETPQGRGQVQQHQLIFEAKKDQSTNRAITISEFRHILKRIRSGDIRRDQVNFYSEF